MPVSKLKRRIKLYNMYQTCCYCSKDLTFEQFTIEHVKPTGIGGTNQISNLEVSCHSCNQNHDNIHKIWGFVCYHSHTNQQHYKYQQYNFCIKTEQLFNLLNHYIYKSRRRIYHPIYDIFSTVKLLREYNRDIINEQKPNSLKIYRNINRKFRKIIKFIVKFLKEMYEGT